MTAYHDFLQRKVCIAPTHGFTVDQSLVNTNMKPHCQAIVPWLLEGGRRALFASFGLHKTVIQLEAVRLASEHVGGRGLIVLPLGVRQEFRRDAVERLGWAEEPRFIRRIEEADATGVYLTNYETVRDGKLDPRHFDATSLDEADCLRGFGGSKTFREFMRLFAGDDRQAGVKTEGIRYRFVATATPSPNEYIELLAYAAYLGIMDVGAAKTRFFKRNSEKADQLTLHPHKEEEFWLWVASWALFVQKPSDLGFSDEGYVLPELDIHWHELPSDYSSSGTEKDGQGRMFSNAAIGITDAAREKRQSLSARVDCLQQIRAIDPDAHRIIWHDLEDERRAIEKAIPDAVSVYGSQDLDLREQAIIDFSNGKFRELAAKPVIAGAGCNFQRHCAWSVFLGIGFKFRDFIQAVHRIQRFGQQKRVRLDLIYTEAERDIRRQLERKWAQHNKQADKMTAIIREFGLAHAAMASQLARSLGVERVEASGEFYTVVNNDCVLETQRMDADSIHLIVTSIPFGNQYEYSPSYNDFGHTDDGAHFWAQMDFLIPELYRVLQPGRVAAIHVKDRIQPGGINGLGFQTVEPFSDQCVERFTVCKACRLQRARNELAAAESGEIPKAVNCTHLFAALARKTITTDVVRENAQTYRLGWSEQCKDGSRMGAGMPEYMLIFRKPPTDRSNGYADTPVIKSQPECLDADGNRMPYKNGNKLAFPLTPDTYSRARWQFDAHGFMRSSGNRPLMPEDLDGLDQAAIFQLFKKHSLENVYDFRHDVKIADTVDESGWLPTTFMLLQPQSWQPDVWTDVTRMLGLNTAQGSKGKEKHICPLPFDIVDRCIEQYSMKGEKVYDPFAGLMTTPYRSIKLGRYGYGCELSPPYFLDGAAYCASASQRAAIPDLFDLLDAEQQEGAA